MPHASMAVDSIQRMPLIHAVVLQSEEEVAAAVAEGNFFSLVAHQYWGVWALIQARYSPIDFDYFGYSRLRWDEYHKRKNGFMQALQPHLKA